MQPADDRWCAVLDGAGRLLAAGGTPPSLAFAAGLTPAGEPLPAVLARGPGGDRLAEACRLVLDGRAPAALPLGDGTTLQLLPLQGGAPGPAWSVIHTIGDAADELHLYRSIFEAAVDGIAVLDTQGRYLLQNASHRALIGYDDAELAVATPAIHMGEEAFARIGEELAGRGVYRGEVLSRPKHGGERTIELVAFAVHDARGELRYLVGMKRDASERTAQEQELRRRGERERLLNRLLEIALEPQPLPRLLARGLALVVAPPWLAEPLRGALVLPEGEDGSACQVGEETPALAGQALDPRRCPCGRALAATPEVCPGTAGPGLLGVEHTWVTVGAQDEPQAWLLLAAGPSGRLPLDELRELLEMAGRALAGGLARRRAELRLRRSELRLRQIAASVPGLLYQFQLEPDGSRSFPYVSAGSEALLGVPAEDLMRDPEQAFGRVHPEDLAGLEQSIVESAQRLSTWSYLVRFQDADGVLRWLEGSARPRPTAHGGVRWTGMVMDVTERRRVELELAEAKDQALAAARAKEQFLANVSHELRTPLNAVIGMSDLLLGTPGLAGEQRDYVRTIHSSAETLLLLINDLLDFTKIESGHMRLEAAPFSLRELLESSLALVKAAAAEKGLGLTCLVEDGAPRRLVGDIVRLRQVLSNLLSNAVKFTEAGEALLTVSCQQAGEGRARLRFAVQDTGIGIPRDRQPRLFEAFNQLDASTTRRYGGTGLGLAISRRLTELMGGELQADSAPGVGSTFTFSVELPVDGAAAGPGCGGHVSALRLLLVEPDPVVRERLAQSLRAWGVSWREALGWDEALPLLEQEPADAVLYDEGQAAPARAPDLERELRGRLGPGGALVALRAPEARGAVSGGLEPDAVLLTPLRASPLFRVLTGLLGRGPANPCQAQEIAAPGERPRLLLVEDHPVNRKVALSILERLGYDADVARHGREALEAVLARPYGVVLMDLQMPEMDGLEATRCLRELLPPGRQPRVVAMTASAGSDERERCLAAGMDDYLSKPIRVEELRAVIERALARTPEREDGLDRDVLAQVREVSGSGGADLLAEMIGLFLEDSPLLLTQVRQAWQVGDCEALWRAAHALKGSALTLGVRRLTACCVELERRARAGEREHAGELLPELAAALEEGSSLLQAEVRRGAAAAV